MQKKRGLFGGLQYRLNLIRTELLILISVCIILSLTGCMDRPGTVQAKNYEALDTVLHSAVPGAIVWKDSKFEFATRIETDGYGRCLYRVAYTSFFGDGTVAYIVTQGNTKDGVAYDPFRCYLLKLPSSGDATTEEIVQLCADNGWGKPIDTSVLATTMHTETDFPSLEGEEYVYSIHNRVEAEVAQDLRLTSSLLCIADGLQLFDADGRQVVAIRVDKDEWATATQNFTCYFALYSPTDTPKISNLVLWKDPEDSRNELMAFCQSCDIKLP